LSAASVFRVALNQLSTRERNRRGSTKALPCCERVDGSEQIGRDRNGDLDFVFPRWLARARRGSGIGRAADERIRRWFAGNRSRLFCKDMFSILLKYNLNI
jgi:hypothetical protein